jgi:hypothetical protein
MKEKNMKLKLASHLNNYVSINLMQSNALIKDLLKWEIHVDILFQKSQIKS